MKKFKIETPHAAVKIWNYIDRIADTGALSSQANKIKEEIISTLSLVNVQTSKSKGDPVGTFNFTLAPTRNWVSVITPGSWCAIFMSNEPIVKETFNVANKNYVKMFGRIDNVRVEVSVDDEGARTTRYMVSGQDWSSMLNNTFYVDPLLSDPSQAQNSEGNALYLQIIKNLLSKNNTPSMFDIASNLQSLLSIFGKPLDVPDTTRLAKPTYNVVLPSEAVKFFGFVDAEVSSNGKAIGSAFSSATNGGFTTSGTSTTDLNKIIVLQTGSLNSSEGLYDTEIRDGGGWLNPFSMVGQHSLWSIMMDNCNYALNEMYPEMRWLGEDKPQLTLYSRIKPFSFQENPIEGVDTQLRAQFKNVVTHRLHDETVISVNAGTNWRDKFNFVEIKPDLSEFNIHDLASKLKSQAYQKKPGGVAAATDVFDREGFRPLIYSIKQVPIQVGADTGDKYDVELLNKWVNMLQEWFFDTHRLLNGRITMTGSSEYIPVGDNIMFDAGLIGVSANYNSVAPSAGKCFVLGHVESVQHSFTVESDGARAFQTVIQFVRGIIVNENKSLIGDGCLDTLSTDLQYQDSRNSITMVGTSTVDDPQKGK